MGSSVGRLLALAIRTADDRHRSWAGLAACAALSVASVFAAIAVSSSTAAGIA